jgi:hypothetical protein
MSLRASEVVRLDEGTFSIYLSDDSYVVITAEDLATILLSRKDKVKEAKGPRVLSTKKHRAEASS